MSTRVAAVPSRARWQGALGTIRAAVAVPLGFFLAAEALMLVTALANDVAPLQASSWAKWDSGYYLQIVGRGYYLAACNGTDGPLGSTCGDAAWFPGISWLTEVPVALGVPAAAAMLLLVRLFALGTLVVVWNGLLDRRTDARALAALAFVAFVPGSVYFHALFPMSLATCAIAGALACVRHGRFRAAAACGAVAATSYTTAVLVAPVLVAWVLLDRGVPLGRRVRRALLVGGGPVVGGAAVVAVMWAQSGAVDAFSQVQSQYEYDPGPPTAALFDQLDPLLSGAVGIGAVLGLQALLAAVLVVGSVVWAVVVRARGLELAVVGLAVVLWAVPLALDQISLYRSDSLLVPLAVVIARLPRPLALAAAACAVVLAAPVAGYYVRGVLV